MRRKKLRGFKRHFHAHQLRADLVEKIDIARIEQWHYDYKKLGLVPWYVSDKPPLVIRQLWLLHLLRNFQQWHEQLTTRYTDFYLAIWIFEPEFGGSQLVAAIEERKIKYEGSFGELLDLQLPKEYGSLPGITNLHWTPQAHVLIYRPDDFVDRASWALSKPHWPVETADGESCIAVQVGVVWVGRQA